MSKQHADKGQPKRRTEEALRERGYRLTPQRAMEESLLTPLTDSLLRRYGFRADLRHLAIFGRCSKCSR